MKNYFNRLNKTINRLGRQEKGNILILALIMLAVGSLIIVPLMSFMATGLNIARSVEQDTINTYAADAGIEHGIAYLNKVEKPNINDGTPEIVLPTIIQTDGTMITVILNAVPDQSNLFKITSVSTNPQGETRSITSFVELNSTGGVFDNAIVALDGNVKLSGSAKVIGDIFVSGGGLNLSGSSMVDGDVYSDEVIDMAWSTRITGSATTPEYIDSPNPNPNVGDPNPGSPSQDPAVLTDTQISDIINNTLGTVTFTPPTPGTVTHSSLTFSYYPAPPSTYSNAIHTSGDMTISTGTNITFTQPVHVGGDLIINSSGKTFIFQDTVTVEGSVIIQNGIATFQDTLWVGQNLTRTGSATAAFNGQVMVIQNINLGSANDLVFGSTIYSGGDFWIHGGSDVYISDDIYIGGDLDLDGSSQFIGGYTVVTMGRVTLSGATKLTDAGEIPFILAPNGQFEITGSGYASAVLYAPEADVVISGSAKLFGAVIGNSVTISGSGIIEYPPGLENRDDLPGSGGDGSIVVLSYDIN
jgi:hypothetical protein